MTAPRIHATRRPVRHPFAPGSPSALHAAGGVEPVGAPTVTTATVGANHDTKEIPVMTTLNETTPETILAEALADLESRGVNVPRWLGTESEVLGGVSPISYLLNNNAEGTWEHWVTLAQLILNDPLTELVRPDVYQAVPVPAGWSTQRVRRTGIRLVCFLVRDITAALNNIAELAEARAEETEVAS